jgi:hypothetical protein
MCIYIYKLTFVGLCLWATVCKHEFVSIFANLSHRFRTKLQLDLIFCWNRQFLWCAFTQVTILNLFWFSILLFYVSFCICFLFLSISGPARSVSFRFPLNRQYIPRTVSYLPLSCLYEIACLLGAVFTALKQLVQLHSPNRNPIQKGVGGAVTGVVELWFFSA